MVAAVFFAFQMEARLLWKISQINKQYKNEQTENLRDFAHEKRMNKRTNEKIETET